MRSKALGTHPDDHAAGTTPGRLAAGNVEGRRSMPGPRDALGVAARRYKVYSGWMTQKLLKNLPERTWDRGDRGETVRRAAARAALR
ncbi:hypothetical protein [Streptomyces sp. NPDC001070]